MTHVILRLCRNIYSEFKVHSAFLAIKIFIIGEKNLFGVSKMFKLQFMNRNENELILLLN